MCHHDGIEDVIIKQRQKDLPNQSGVAAAPVICFSYKLGGVA